MCLLAGQYSQFALLNFAGSCTYIHRHAYMQTDIHAYHYIPLHTVTSHCTTFHCMSLHFITLHHITLQYVTLEYMAFIPTSLLTCLFNYLLAHVRTYIHACTHTCMHSYFFRCLHTYMLTHTHTYQTKSRAFRLLLRFRLSISSQQQRATQAPTRVESTHTDTCSNWNPTCGIQSLDLLPMYDLKPQYRL